MGKLCFPVCSPGRLEVWEHACFQGLSARFLGDCKQKGAETGKKASPRIPLSESSVFVVKKYFYCLLNGSISDYKTSVR